MLPPKIFNIFHIKMMRQYSRYHFKANFSDYIHFASIHYLDSSTYQFSYSNKIHLQINTKQNFRFLSRMEL